jgi:hypothetical protein
VLLLPSSVDHTAGQSPVIDQGLRGTCLAAAATAGHEFLRAPLRLSVEHLAWNAQRRAAVPKGATLRGIHAALTKDGQCEARAWPYDPMGPSSCPADVGTTYTITDGFVDVATLDVIRAGITAGDALVIGIEISDGLINGDPLPIRPGPAGETTNGWHACLAVGYDDRNEVLRIKNSWGRGWGDSGYADLTYEYVRRYGHAALSMQL